MKKTVHALWIALMLVVAAAHADPPAGGDSKPAVRKADEDTLVVADGTSCRSQIEHGSGREALHVARVLEMALARH